MYLYVYIGPCAIIAIKAIGAPTLIKLIKLLDAIDEEIVAIMVTRWRTSSYSIWAQMKADAQRKGEGATPVLHYKNVNKRVARLAKAGLLKEVFLGVHNVHGRRDFEVTILGLEHLIPYILTHTKEIEKIVDYTNKHGMNPALLKKSMLDKFLIICDSIYEFENLTKDIDKSYLHGGTYKNHKKAENNTLQRQLLNLRKEILLTYLTLEDEKNKPT
jgi:hypothetical protein